jgi:hypothetical protein
MPNLTGKPTLGTPKLGIAIIRTQEQIATLKARMKSELDGLPDYSLFGDSTAEDKAELRQMIIELDVALKGIVPGTRSEVGYWLTDERSTLGIDYGMEP